MSNYDLLDNSSSSLEQEIPFQKNS